MIRHARWRPAATVDFSPRMSHTVDHTSRLRRLRTNYFEVLLTCWFPADPPPDVRRTLNVVLLRTFTFRHK